MNVSYLYLLPFTETLERRHASVAIAPSAL